jgi:hypothetical protein
MILSRPGKKTARRILGEGGKTFVIPTLAACDVF